MYLSQYINGSLCIILVNRYLQCSVVSILEKRVADMKDNTILGVWNLTNDQLQRIYNYICPIHIQILTDGINLCDLVLT